jgi:hypothetical protein
MTIKSGDTKDAVSACGGIVSAYRLVGVSAYPDVLFPSVGNGRLWFAQIQTRMGSAHGHADTPIRRYAIVTVFVTYRRYFL